MDKQERMRLILCIFYELESSYLLNHLENVEKLKDKLIDLLEDIL